MISLNSKIVSDLDICSNTLKSREHRFNLTKYQNQKKQYQHQIAHEYRCYQSERQMNHSMGFHRS